LESLSKTKMKVALVVVALVYFIGSLCVGVVGSGDNRPTGITVGGHELSTPELKTTLTELKGMVAQAQKGVSLGGSNLVATTPFTQRVKGFYLELTSERLNSSSGQSDGIYPLNGTFGTEAKRKIGRETAETDLGIYLKQLDKKLEVYKQFLSFQMETFNWKWEPSMKGMFRTQVVRDTVEAHLKAYRNLFDFMDRVRPTWNGKSQYIFANSSEKAEYEALDKTVLSTSSALYSAQMTAEQDKQEPLLMLIEWLEQKSEARNFWRKK
jgi:hypothetical protein